MIAVQHEDIEELRKWGMGLENVQEKCVFCAKPTRFWHMGTNHPVCEQCASVHTTAELPIRAKKSTEQIAVDA